MSVEQTVPPAEGDALSDAVERVIVACVMLLVGLVALPLFIPVVVARVAGEGIATKVVFWRVWRWQWVMNTAGVAAVAVLLAWGAVLFTEWAASGEAATFFVGDWGVALWPTFGPWAGVNLAAGVLLLPVTWSIRRRRIAGRVRTRRISDVLRQERIEVARKRAADAATAARIGIRLDPSTGRITGVHDGAVTVPHPVDGRVVFGFATRSTVRTVADRFHDTRQVRDWVDPTGRYVVMPDASSAARALIVAESGSGKTVLINGLVLCALEYGWPVFVIDAKGDPADARSMVGLAHAAGHTATVGGRWDLFSGTAEQVTAKLMRLMPVPDGANQHYLDEIRGVLQAVQAETPIRTVGDLRDRLVNPGPHVRDQFDLTLVNQTVDRNGGTAGSRALQSLTVALRPLERWIAQDGWSYAAPPAELTVSRSPRSMTPMPDSVTCFCWTCGISSPRDSRPATSHRCWSSSTSSPSSSPARRTPATPPGACSKRPAPLASDSSSRRRARPGSPTTTCAGAVRSPAGGADLRPLQGPRRGRPVRRNHDADGSRRPRRR